jgi:hypothetical protein
LTKAAEKLSRESFVPVEGIVMFILVGIRPLLPDTCWREEYQLGGQARRVTLEIYTGGLTYARFRQLHRELMAMNHSEGEPATRPLNGRDQRFIELLRELGGEPTSDKTQFWETFRKEWNKRYPKERYGTWNGPMMALRRLNQRRELKRGGSR